MVYLWRRIVKNVTSNVTSDVLNVSKENGSLIFPQFKTFTSFEFRLSAVVTWQKLGLQYCGVVALARNVEFSCVLFLSCISNRTSSLG